MSPRALTSIGLVGVLSCGLQWLIQAFSFGMGNGIAPANQVIWAAGILGLPAVLIIVVIAVFSSDRSAAAATLIAGGAVLANAGAICVVAASPMIWEGADRYSWLDRHPDQAGLLMIAAGLVMLIGGLWRLRRPSGTAD